ncbi:hypothetical protein M1446_02505 [Candidatus Dependentiae bacterium]|nr:hypothetical protein [Candidatus Dependentiae bacterium]
MKVVNFFKLLLLSLILIPNISSKSPKKLGKYLIIKLSDYHKDLDISPNLKECINVLKEKNLYLICDANGNIVNFEDETLRDGSLYCKEIDEISKSLKWFDRYRQKTYLIKLNGNLKFWQFTRSYKELFVPIRVNLNEN